MARIERETASGEIHFKIDLGGSGMVKDVRLAQRDFHTVDASIFGEPRFSVGSTVYGVETNDPGFSALALWEPSRKSLSISAGAAAKRYKGSSLDDCILQAHDDGALQ
jgi:hypothetical protein